MAQTATSVIDDIRQRLWSKAKSALGGKPVGYNKRFTERHRATGSSLVVIDLDVQVYPNVAAASAANCAVFLTSGGSVIGGKYTHR